MEKREIKVIIIDDNKEFCSILTDYLESQSDIVVLGIGYDGNEGVRLVKEKKPDLVILDIIMPNLDGLGVLERLSNLNLSNPPKVIILSTATQEKITTRALQLGAHFYVVKPFDMKKFTHKVRQLVENIPVECK